MPHPQNLVQNPDLQRAVDRFVASLGTPERLFKLAPTTKGNPGNAGAINPAVVLTVTSAFEGFAEEFLATLLAIQGQGFGQIAKAVGKWNNPTLRNWADEVKKLVGTPSQIDAGPRPKIVVDRENATGNWNSGQREWADVLTDGDAWMQVRHLLSHGLATGWRAETWPAPLHKQVPHASSVLRPKTAGKHGLERPGARSCARIYTIGAQHIADVAAADLGATLDWSRLPAFG